MAMRIDVNKLIEPIQPLIDLPPSRVDQSIGNYVNDRMPCCVGAHMANLLGVAKKTTYDFLNGVDEWIKLVGGNRAHAILMLRYAGAGLKPLCADPWPAPHDQVFANLKHIEELPSLSDVFFKDEVLFNVNFKGMDLSKTVFEECSLGGADFEGCNLQGASFLDSDLEYCKFQNADLTDADLRDADLRNADFIGATLKHTRFDGADLYGATFRNAKLIGVDTQADCFFGVSIADAAVIE